MLYILELCSIHPTNQHPGAMRRFIYALLAALFMVSVGACGQRAAEQQPATEQQEAPAAVDTTQQDTTMAAPDTAAAAEQM